MVMVAKSKSPVVAVPRARGVVLPDADIAPCIVYQFVLGGRLCRVIYPLNNPSQSKLGCNLGPSLVHAVIGNLQGVSKVRGAECDVLVCVIRAAQRIEELDNPSGNAREEHQTVSMQEYDPPKGG